MVVRLGEEFNKAAGDIIFMNDRIDVLKGRVDALTKPKRKGWKFWKRK